mgnify:CR=1 FL=1
MALSEHSLFELSKKSINSTFLFSLRIWKGDFRMTDHYQAVTELLEANFQEIDGYDFYQYIFPDNECCGEWNTDFSKPNAIYLYCNLADQGTRRK